MDQVRLHFVAPDGKAQVLPLDFAVVHVPTPRRRREAADTPIYDQLVNEFYDAELNGL